MITMPDQGSIELLNEPAAQEQLQSVIPARLGYVSRDGTPRVVPIWFHWNGSDIIMGTPSNAPKVKDLRSDPNVALTIDSEVSPPKVLMIRGTAKLSIVDGVLGEYELAAARYLGVDQGKQWCDMLRAIPALRMCRITVRPAWVGLLDFQTRYPRALEPLFL
jgi:Pyridoxamine 5'-phosphate oxidase